MSYQSAKHESDRLSALQEYNILDTITEKEYDDITHLASVICNVPIALISFVDRDRQWFKSHKGLSASETDREYSFCAHAINTPDKAFIIPDAQNDERFRDNPLVTGDPNIVFYAGFPLVTEKGFSLGTICVIDSKTHELNEDQVKALEVLSGQVMKLLEMRKTNHDLLVLKMELETRNSDLEQFAMVVSHDIKSPLTGILLGNEILEKEFGEALGPEGLSMVKVSNNAASKIKTLVEGILGYYKGDSSKSRDNIELAGFLKSIIDAVITPRQIEVTYDLTSDHIYMNRTQLEQIFFNLISNSIRYNDKPIPQIKISFREETEFYRFVVSDNGIGIAPENYDKIFSLFQTVSKKDVFGIKSHGIGLPTIKKIVENFNGAISVTSVINEGTDFHISIAKERHDSI